MGLACENAEEDSRKSRRSHERRPRIELATSSTATTLVFAGGENNQVKPRKRGDYSPWRPVLPLGRAAKAAV